MTRHRCVGLQFRFAFQDDRLTVTRSGAVSGNPSILHFQYKLNERRFSCWDTVLATNCLYLEIPSGALPEGSKEGYVQHNYPAAFTTVWGENHSYSMCNVCAFFVVEIQVRLKKLEVRFFL